MRGLLGADGVIVLPTLPTIAPRLDASEAEFEAFRARAISMLCIAGLAGLPADLAAAPARSPAVRSACR